MAVSINYPVAGLGNNTSIASGSKVMVNGDIIFTISNGPIQIMSLLSECVTVNNTTASTLQWNSAPTVGSATTISGASSSLISATAGTTVLLSPTALTTAPVIVAASAGGVQLGTDVANRIIVMAGTLKLVIGVGSTTGTWRHYLNWIPLNASSSVAANQ